MSVRMSCWSLGSENPNYAIGSVRTAHTRKWWWNVTTQWKGQDSHTHEHINQSLNWYKMLKKGFLDCKAFSHLSEDACVVKTVHLNWKQKRVDKLNTALSVPLTFVWHFSWDDTIIWNLNCILLLVCTILGYFSMTLAYLCVNITESAKDRGKLDCNGS